MIYTLTLNPSIDYVVEVEPFQIGQLNRIQKETKFPGGKGINVSRVLHELRVESTALGFIGGFTGRYIEDYLNSENIKSDFIRVKGDTRINVKLKTDQETEINGQGPQIENENIEQLKTKIKSLKKGDQLILSGSIPAALPTTIYKELVKICVELDASFVVDAEGNLLRNVLAYRPFLIKPNHHELADLFQTTIDTPEEAIKYGKQLLEMGAQNVIVSMAEKGAIFINKEKVLHATVPSGDVKSSVGAGDSLVAGFLAQFSKTGNVEEAFQYGVASGSATAFSFGLCTKEKIEALLPQVKVSKRGDSG
ncbi:1-phosphofructokinase [Bacillus sp. FJAT-50079]|uniref:1-phosphofructokinase n=1 Tax=Bacillus sp. FJAT-50079 TaxID=2833577 RepID=UPI001BCA195E|nr:1-phosphofructokinase [Bacillus sp. FJAT-50079]MBS4208473.1 1-phosphofructokinase [Bacillus sp. FJAT-50079]